MLFADFDDIITYIFCIEYLVLYVATYVGGHVPRKGKPCPANPNQLNSERGAGSRSRADTRQCVAVGAWTVSSRQEDVGPTSTCVCGACDTHHTRVREGGQAVVSQHLQRRNVDDVYTLNVSNIEYPMVGGHGVRRRTSSLRRQNQF